MCDLATGLTIASAAFGYMKQSEQADAQSRAINQQAQAQNEAIAAQSAEQRADLQNKASESAIAAQKATAAIRAVAGESGVSGNTVAAVEVDSQRGLSRDIGTLETNRANAFAQAQRGITANTMSAANKQAAVVRPSLIGTGLQIAGAYNDYSTKNDKRVPQARA